MIDCIQSLLEHNNVSRKMLLGTVGKMAHSEFTKDLGVGKSSIRNILIHLVNTELYWMQEVLNCSNNVEYLNEQDYDSVAEIMKTWKSIESETREIFRDCNDETLQHVKSIRWSDRTVSFTVAKVFIHMITHEIHHRGLIIGLLRMNGYNPPDVNMI